MAPFSSIVIVKSVDPDQLPQMTLKGQGHRSVALPGHGFLLVPHSNYGCILHRLARKCDFPSSPKPKTLNISVQGHPKVKVIGLLNFQYTVSQLSPIVTMGLILAPIDHSARAGQTDTVAVAIARPRLEATLLG